MKIRRKEKRIFSFIQIGIGLVTGNLRSLLMPIFFDLFEHFAYYPRKL